MGDFLRRWFFLDSEKCNSSDDDSTISFATVTCRCPEGIATVYGWNYLLDDDLFLQRFTDLRNFSRLRSVDNQAGKGERPAAADIGDESVWRLSRASRTFHFRNIQCFVELSIDRIEFDGCNCFGGLFQTIPEDGAF